MSRVNWIKMLCDRSRVEALSFVTEQTLLVEHNARASVVVMRGVDEEYSEVVDIDNFIGVGEFKVEDKGDDFVVLSGSIPHKLGIKNLAKSDLTLFSLRTGRLQSFIPTATYREERASVNGVVYVDTEHDERYAYTSNRLVNRLLDRDSVASKAIVKVAQGAQAEVRAEIERVVGDRFEVVSRDEINAPSMR